MGDGIARYARKGRDEQPKNAARQSARIGEMGTTSNHEAEKCVKEQRRRNEESTEPFDKRGA
jgi:hypothetical protein